MKTSWHTPRLGRLITEILLFVAAAYALLGVPIKRHAAEVGLHAGPAARIVVIVLVWLLSVSCLLLLRRAHKKSNADLSALLTGYIVLALLIFFAVERLVFWGFQYAGLWPPRHSAHMLHPWIQIVSGFLVMLATVCLLPRLRNLRGGGTLARKEHDRFLAAMESSLDDFYIFDGVPDETGRIVDFRFSYVNPNALRRLGATHESLAGKILTEVRPFMISSGLIEKYQEVVRTGDPFTAEVYLDDERIHATWLHVQVVKLGDGIAITSRDITEHKKMIDRISYMAHHDQLTGLPNRSLLEDRLQQAILRAQREQYRVAVILMDLDNFKEINDTRGHAQGDAVLSAFAARVRNSLRESDTVARIGGDEFVVIMPGFQNPNDIRRCGGQLAQCAAEPLIIDSKPMRVTVSVGISIYPDAGQSVEELLKQADMAMYAVKGNGRNGILTFDSNSGNAPTPARD